jgi:hypothetical protein
VSAYDVALAFILIAVVLIMVADHRRGWLTETLIGGLRSSQKNSAASRNHSRRRLNRDQPQLPEASGSAGD